MLAGAALALDTFLHARAQLLHAHSEPIAHALQLTEIEQRRSARIGAGDRDRCGDEREPLGDDRRARRLQSRDLRPQRSSGAALVNLDLACGARGLAAGALATANQHLIAVYSIDDLLLAVGHTHLLAGKAQVYQRMHAR